MKISLITIGSRGDVQPFVALGVHLKSRGHEVRLAAPAEFSWMAAVAGLDFKELPGRPTEFINRPEIVAAIRKGPSMARMATAARKNPLPEEDDPYYQLSEVGAAMEGADLVVNSWMTKMACLFGPEVPACTVSTWPRVSTKHFPALGWKELGSGVYNRFSHWMWGQLEWQFSRPTVNRLRARCGQPPLGLASPLADAGHRRPLLHPFSSHVLPRPTDWPAHAHLTGYLFWDRPQPTDPALARFCDVDPGPVVLSLGSFSHIYPWDRIVATVLAASRRAGRRVVVLGGPDEIDADDVFQVREADYPWLFARASAVIHHGGMGTTAEVVRAGTPSVTLPSFADQPFWAGVAHRYGVGTRPVPLTKLTEDRLSHVLSECFADKAMAERAVLLGERVQREDGPARAAEILESWMA